MEYRRRPKIIYDATWTVNNNKSINLTMFTGNNPLDNNIAKKAMIRGFGYTKWVEHPALFKKMRNLRVAYQFMRHLRRSLNVSGVQRKSWVLIRQNHLARNN